MLSSTSSSNRSPPNFPWRTVWVGALAIIAIFVGVMELRLLVRGFPTTSVDSELSWLRQRERASKLGERALVLIGDSRMQCEQAFAYCIQHNWLRVALVGESDLADIAKLVASGTRIELEIVSCNTELGGFDAAMITDIMNPQSTYDAIKDKIEDQRLITLNLLHISRSNLLQEQCVGAQL